MKYVTVGVTDKGTRKTVNQDAVLMVTLGKCDEDVLTIVCDGMGGLDQGEFASHEVVRAFLDWSKLKYLKLEKAKNLEAFEDLLYESWESLLQEVHQTIYTYGRKNKMRIGTTVTAMLFRKGIYYIVHVGDSRSYEIKKDVRRLTQDQTLADIVGGIHESDSNVLIQGIGASRVIRPVYQSGKAEQGAVYLLCSDGLGNTIKDIEFPAYLNIAERMDKVILERACRELVGEARKRGEKDDISVLLIYQK
ncbi:serine/threonine protein phosphatase [Claveliimonas bilis]|uniref:PP2C family protein-serine/threonine phosphatase n=1 Tax=Claveliimonas bilis TaxID=3028070 RepID=UPI00292FAE1E|nr:PP2C family serine/threonine-protein phosphatase [Claveliimonas bilis]BDZ84769.1 serine/threonine protein phosphatase [Claveliimonas bilis]